MATAGSNGRGKGKGNGRQTLTFTIDSTYASIRSVQKQLLDAAGAHGFDEHNVFSINLALEEALVNAIKHGNKLDAKKKVHVHATVTAREFEIVIEDEGPGFDRKHVPDPTHEDNLHKCSGRGLLLIESYMNEVEYARGGRRLRMVKRNDANVLPRK